MNKSHLENSLQKHLKSARSAWKFRGEKRPEFAAAPEVNQESVWDYPRPPRIEEAQSLVKVFLEAEVNQNLPALIDFSFWERLKFI